MFRSLPNIGNNVQEISRELLGTPDEAGLSAAKPLKEDSDYLIYSDGRLFSKKQNRFLKGKIDNVGYQTYRLAIKNELTSKKGKMFYAHRLVAEYFLENDNPKEKIYVHHKDGNKLNNHKNNLEWVTPKQNSQEYLKTYSRQKVNPRYKVKDLPGEEWRVVLQNLLYSVSNKGRVINNKTNRLLAIDTCQKYSRVSFNDKKHYYLHRLVYCTFYNDYDLDGYVIDHLDNNTRNNCLENLKKVTHSENSYRRFH